MIQLTRIQYNYFRNCFAERPEFVEDPQNVSVILGREGTLDCKVRHVGSYKVFSWLLLLPITFGYEPFFK